MDRCDKIHIYEVTDRCVKMSIYERKGELLLMWITIIYSQERSVRHCCEAVWICCCQTGRKNSRNLQ